MKENFRPWLIQRLNKPVKMAGGLPANIFSFGGGFKDGGLTKEAAAEIYKVCSFDYMGAAEYEFGALPKTLYNIFQNKKDFVSGQVDVGGKKVYYIIRAKVKKDMEEFLVHSSHIEPGHSLHTDKYRTRDYVGLKSTLEETNKDRTFVPVGWLIEDDNKDNQSVGFFFTDKEMFEGFKELFDVS